MDSWVEIIKSWSECAYVYTYVHTVYTDSQKLTKTDGYEHVNSTGAGHMTTVHFNDLSNW